MASATKLTAKKKLPPLENGDRMSRKEFHRRYVKMPKIKAELIQGVVHVASPVSFDPHARHDKNIRYWLATYALQTPGTESGGNATVKIDSKNELQPDQLLFIDPKYGGQLKVAKYLVGAPELVAEISSTTMSIDLGSKKKVYLKAGVREYIVVRSYDREVDWFVNRNGRFQPLSADENGILRSELFPGLWLNGPALFAENLPAMLTTLNEGLASPDHQAFRHGSMA